MYGHDSPGLDRALTAAGFTAGWERSVLIVGPLPDEGRDTPSVVASDRSAEPPRQETRNLYRVRDQAERAWKVATGSPGPHAVPYAEMIADGASEDGDVRIEVLLEDGLVVAVARAHPEEWGTFTVVGGLTRADADFVKACTDRWRRLWSGRALLAEADGPLRARLLAAGFSEATTVRSYHWSPPGAPETTRPAQFLDWLHDDGPLWDRFYADFDFKPSMTYRPTITDPPLQPRGTCTPTTASSRTCRRSWTRSSAADCSPPPSRGSSCTGWTGSTTATATTPAAPTSRDARPGPARARSPTATTTSTSRTTCAWAPSDTRGNRH